MSVEIDVNRRDLYQWTRVLFIGPRTQIRPERERNFVRRYSRGLALDRATLGSFIARRGIAVAFNNFPVVPSFLVEEWLIWSDKDTISLTRLSGKS